MQYLSHSGTSRVRCRRLKGRNDSLFIEDARELTLAALEHLESQKTELGLPDLQIWSLPEFVDFAKGNKLKRREKEAIVDQALLVIDQLYAHLPFKRARYAVDPVQRLRLLRFQLADTGDRQFHSEMIDTFVQLRDAHTFYGLPTPYRGAIAFLPFHLDFYHDERRHRRFVVTNILQGFNHPFFAPKAEITYWNGIP